MKIFSIVVKVVVALAAVAGAVYVAATYGDKIVAWCKGLINGSKCEGCTCECDCDDDCTCEGECSCECKCDCCDDEDVEVEVVEEAAEEVVADEADFEG